MRILCASDIHSDFEYLKKYRDFAKANSHDLVIVSGDLVDFGFGQEKDIDEHMRLLEAMAKITQSELKRKNKLSVLNSPAELFNAIPIVAEQLSKGKMYSDQIRQIADLYLKNLDKAIGIMSMQYDLIRDLFDCFGDKALFLPGNYDPDLEYTSLNAGNIHKKVKEAKGFRVAGYGGAGSPHGMPIGPVTIPLELSVAFNEIIHEDGVMSSPLNFLEEAKPDIIIAHTPPFKYLDEMEVEEGKKAHVGSPGFHKYANEGNLEVFLCGHNHNGAGAEKIRRQDKFAVVINAGSLHRGEGGKFVEIELDDQTKKFISATQYGILPLGNILKEVKYIRSDDDSLKPVTVNHVLD